MYADGFFDDDPESFKEQLAQVQRELNIIPITDLKAIQEAADTLAYIGQVWDEATMEEKRDIIRLIFGRVEIDVQQNRIAALLPYAIFLPLFRQSKHLLEVETGRFILLWPPDLAEQEGVDEHLSALLEPESHHLAAGHRSAKVAIKSAHQPHPEPLPQRTASKRSALWPADRYSSPWLPSLTAGWAQVGRLEPDPSAGNARTSAPLRAA
ncbi:MAG: hypothetical protein B6243_12995 [Anaerolineaceae bacterium 4572_5.2]|nr:MAG: hypothetical protein B6243_12995 [Anaerolineaceae bacterium 4572_5.2]